jgi:hypothetical protein
MYDEVEDRSPCRSCKSKAQPVALRDRWATRKFKCRPTRRISMWDCSRVEGYTAQKRARGDFVGINVEYHRKGWLPFRIVGGHRHGNYTLRAYHLKWHYYGVLRTIRFLEQFLKRRATFELHILCKSNNSKNTISCRCIPQVSQCHHEGHFCFGLFAGLNRNLALRIQWNSP